MPKSTQTRFLGIRDNHNHYTSLRLLFYRPIDVDLSKACYTWSVLDLHVGEIYPVSQSFMIPMLLKKASVGMYSGCDYLLSNMATHYEHAHYYDKMAYIRHTLFVKRHTHPPLRSCREITQNERVMDLRATKWSGFILKPR